MNIEQPTEIGFLGSSYREMLGTVDECRTSRQFAT